MKQCNTCNEEKPVTEFYRRSPAAGGGYEAFCKECKKQKYQRDRAWEHLKERYGITKQDYYNILETQNGQCGICGCDSGDSKFHVDHCHETGKVRGLLCQKCNCGLGLLGDTVEGLMKALNYMENN